MKRILLLSDSHGNLNNMADAVRSTRPDLIFHLGDCWNDALRLEKLFPKIPMKKVVGNCDWDQGPAELIVEVEGKKFLICHGHAYGVKMSLLTLELSAREKQVDVALYGHTHRLFYDYLSGLTIINPGSIGAPPRGIPASYAVLTVDAGMDQVKMESFYLE